MNKRQSRIVMGAAIGVAAIAVIIDHTRQRLPENNGQMASQDAVIIIDEGEELPASACDKPAVKEKRRAPCTL